LSKGGFANMRYLRKKWSALQCLRIETAKGEDIGN